MTDLEASRITMDDVPACKAARLGKAKTSTEDTPFQVLLYIFHMSSIPYKPDLQASKATIVKAGTEICPKEAAKHPEKKADKKKKHVEVTTCNKCLCIHVCKTCDAGNKGPQGNKGTQGEG
eukprot:4368742-Amphidinium_carterae.1